MNLNTIIAAVTPYAGSVVRKAVVAGGTLLASKGIQANDGDTELVSGAIITIVGVLWSLYNKWAAGKKEGAK